MKAVNQQKNQMSPDPAPDGQSAKKPARFPLWKKITAGAAAIVVLAACVAGVRLLLPRQQETSSDDYQTDLYRIPQYTYNGMIYQPVDAPQATSADIGKLLVKNPDGSELHSYKPAPSEAMVIYKKGDELSLCQFIAPGEGVASGSQILSAFDGNGEIVSIELPSLSKEIRDPEQFVVFTTELSSLQHNDTPLFDNQQEDCIFDGAVCHVPTLHPACTVTYESGVSFTLSYDTATGLLQGFGSSFQPSEALASLLELDSIAVSPPPSPNS